MPFDVASSHMLNIINIDVWYHVLMKGFRKLWTNMMDQVLCKMTDLYFEDDQPFASKP